MFNPGAAGGASSIPRAPTATASSLGFGDGPDHPDAKSYFQAVPRSWRLHAADPYPKPLIDLHKGREAALAAYEGHVGAERTR